MVLCLNIWWISFAGEFHCFNDTFAFMLTDDVESKLEYVMIR